MPTFRSIRVALCNDYDTHGTPEFKDGSLDIKGPIFDVYAPTYHGSPLHVKYSILPPQPENSYFLFKLFVNGIHFVSWGTGPEDGYKGKVSFGLFNGGENERGHIIIEKKALAFSEAWKNNTDQRQGLLEIKVHRANARRRVTKDFEPGDFCRGSDETKAPSLVDIRSYGYLKKPEKQRYYEYALLDPKDSPFVNFRYHFMNLEQLEALAGLAEQDETPRNQSAGSSIEGSASRYSTATSSDLPSAIHTPTSISAQSEPEMASPLEIANHQGTNTQTMFNGTDNFCRRLSFPPRTRLLPTSSQDLLREHSLVPRKPGTLHSADLSLMRSTTEDALGRYGVAITPPERPCAVGTIENMESSDSSLDRSQKSRLLAARGLKGVVANALRRKATGSDEKAKNNGARCDHGSEQS
ncbi:hypothetical protein EV356DRAFT_576820 [Viridothelium virens]|uniref:Uncharacterized protein n=1 Tax=Viridothelium virens TaxID=1048519 RepID=A0A6A6H983_VIRVR|nr:hypothetical protein EV356DRAFT_576820 [Viridothelium virens]